MPEHIFGPAFRDEQAESLYPFSDAASLLTTTGMRLARDLILDASLYPIGSTARLSLNRVSVVSNREVSLVLGDRNTSTLATATCDPLVPTDTLVFTDKYGRPAGVCVVDPERLAEFQTWVNGDHVFPSGTAEFAASCVIPTPEPGVRAIRMRTGELLTGDVWLVGEDGVVVREEDGHIRIDIVGDPLFARRLCSDANLFTAPSFLQSINGISADSYGHFNFAVVDTTTGDTILRLVPLGGGRLLVEAIGQTVAGL